MGADEMKGSDQELLRARARKKAEARYSFKFDAAAYVLVNALLVGIWYYTGHPFPWFVFVLGGWGIGLAFHYSAAYGGLAGGGDWVDRETQKILDEEKK
jgi:2TM domain